MINFKRSWLVILLLFLFACDSETPEPTPTEETSTPAATQERESPSSSPTATEPTTITPTLRATPGASGSAEGPQVKPVSNAIYIRSGPGEGFERTGLLHEDETAEIVGADEFEAWYEIITEDGRQGWVAASVVELLGEFIESAVSPTPRPRITAEPGTTQLRVTINSAYVRSGPGENYPVIDSVSRGSTVAVLGQAKNGTWFNIHLPGGNRGWIGATVTEPVGDWTLDDVRVAATIPAPPPTPQNNCDPAYPTVCIPSSPPDLDCREIAYQEFTVLPPDPHLFDGDQDGVGCEPLPEA